MADLGITEWRCEKCEQRGFVTYDNDAGVYEVRNAIASEHGARSEACALDWGLSGVRVEVK